MMPALGMSVAQGMHDRAGPDAPPICDVCDGDGTVEVATFLTPYGQKVEWPEDIAPEDAPCPKCKLGSTKLPCPEPAEAQ